MPSTYTQNLGLEKPATGEQAGTWGITANASYDFIDMATDGNTSVNLAGVGTATSLDTSQGVASAGRNKLVIWTGALAAPVTVSITPAAAQKLYMMRNETSGGFPIQFKQGAGGSIFTLQALHDAWIYADGQGTVGPVCDDPQFSNVLVTGALALGSDGLPAMLGIVDPAGHNPSLAYRNVATVMVDMGGAEFAIGADSAAVWMQVRTTSNTSWTLALNPLGGVVGIGNESPGPASMLDVTGNIRMSGGRSVLFYHGDSASHVGGIQIVGTGDGNVFLTPTDNAGSPINAAIRLGGFGVFQGNAVGLAVSGFVGLGLASPAEPLVISNWGGYGQLRLAYGGYGAFFRQDGGSLYLMTTNAGDPYGSWSAPIPLQVALGSNSVGIWGGPASGFALTVHGSINLTGGSYYLNGSPLSLQTPWATDIDAAGYSLNNVTTVTAASYRTNSSFGAYTGQSGTFSYTRGGGTGNGVLEFMNGLFVGGN